MNTILNSRTTLALVVVALLAGCADATADPQASKPLESPSQSVSPSSTVPAIQALNAALDISTKAMMSGGITEYYEVDSKPYYTAFFDPSFSGDYRGAGIMSESDQVDLLLELDMYALYQLARAVSNSPFEATSRDGDAFVVTIDSNRKGLQGFPAYMRATVAADGRISSIQYPAARQPDSVRLSYTVDEFGKSILQRANDEIRP